MRKDDIINGYKILKDFTTAGGGLSKWSFAEKSGKEFFIKEFLNPTFPVEGAPGSPKTKERKRKQCEEFEKHHLQLMELLKGKCSHGGNLVVTQKFFRFKAKYYKVTNKVDVSSLTFKDVARLPFDQRRLILITVAHSLKILHSISVVHGDLKPDNILIKETVTGDYSTKLIDFDNSYISGEPPLEDIVGDMVYYSPELGRYIQGDKHIEPKHLQVKSDIFSLGLIYCQYLTGKLPYFDQEKYQYPYVAVNEGVELKIDGEKLPPFLVSIVNEMLRSKPDERPSIETVFSHIKNNTTLEKTSTSAIPKTEESSGRLTGTLIALMRQKKRDTETSDVSKKPKSKLRISKSLKRKPT